MNKLLLLLIASNLALATLQAQNLDETDTAPGVGNSLPKHSLIPNGRFAPSAENSASPASWIAGQQGQISLLDEDGISFVRLHSLEKGDLVVLSSDVPIPAGVAGLEYSALFRTKDVKFGASFLCDARTRFDFLDPQGQQIKPAPGDVIFNSHAKDWTQAKRKFLIPEGATQLRIKLCINKAASGTLDVQEVQLSPLPEQEAFDMAQAPILAAKKKDEDEAELLKILELPPITKELKVCGNKLITQDATPVRLRGVNVCSLEWSAKGENVLRSIKVAVDDWKANAIRLPVNDRLWFGQGKAPATSNDAEAYRRIVDDAVKLAAARGAYIILDLHRFKAPEPGAVDFWSDAATRYKNNPAVLFDLFNEPHGISWEIWRNGGPVSVKQKDNPEPRIYESPGMQRLVETVRETGARNIVIAGGLSYAFNLSGILEGYALEDKTGNGIMYATHFYNWHRGWEKNFLALVEKYPILVGEFGADTNKMSFIPAKNQENPYTWVPDALGMVEKYQLHWTAFSMHPKATPVLITNWNYDPSPFWGAFVKEALGGKVFEMTKLR